jgi:hypothetical protein
MKRPRSFWKGGGHLLMARGMVLNRISSFPFGITRKVPQPLFHPFGIIRRSAHFSTKEEELTKSIICLKLCFVKQALFLSNLRPFG